MNKLYTKLFVVMFFAFAIGGCKVDAPVYPEGTVPTPEFLSGHGGPGTGNTGGGTDSGIGLPLGPSGSVQIQVDGGAVITYNSLSTFDVALPGTENAAGSNIGMTTVASMKGGVYFDLIAETVSTGTFDILDLGFDHYSTVTHSDGSGRGKVKITVLTANQIQGSFTSELADEQGGLHHVVGSFNIKK